jgi:hypothetical protein
MGCRHTFSVGLSYLFKGSRESKRFGFEHNSLLELWTIQVFELIMIMFFEKLNLSGDYSHFYPKSLELAYQAI